MRYRQRLYAIQVGEQGPIKLGIASNPMMRLRALQGAHSETLHLLGETLGLAEMAVHERWQTARIRGEWFQATPELKAWVAGWKNGHPNTRDPLLAAAKSLWAELEPGRHGACVMCGTTLSIATRATCKPACQKRRTQLRRLLRIIRWSADRGQAA